LIIKGKLWSMYKAIEDTLFGKESHSYYRYSLPFIIHDEDDNKWRFAKDSKINLSEPYNTEEEAIEAYNKYRGQDGRV